MLIGKNWKLGADNLNVTISKLHITKPKDDTPPHEYWTPTAYFSNPKDALKWLVNHKITGTGMADLHVVVVAIDELNDMINALENLPEIPRETTSAIESEATR